MSLDLGRKSEERHIFQKLRMLCLPSSPTLLLALEAAPSGLERSQHQEKGDSFLVRAARGFYVLLPHGGRSVPARQVHLGNKKVASLLDG